MPNWCPYLWMNSWNVGRKAKPWRRMLTVSMTPVYLSCFITRPSSNQSALLLWFGLTHLNIQFVSWSLTSLFSTNMAISEMKGQGWKAIPTQWRKARDILTSTLATFLFSSHPKKERDLEAHLNDLLGEITITPQHKTKLNMTKTSMHP